MIGDLVVLLGVGLLATLGGLWLGIVVLAPRLRRRIDEADQRDEPGEPDGRAQ